MMMKMKMMKMAMIVNSKKINRGGKLIKKLSLMKSFRVCILGNHRQAMSKVVMD